MESISCKNCSATGLRLVNGYWVCEYCDSRFLPTREERNASARGTAYAFGSQRSGGSEAAYDLGCNAIIGVDFDYITLDPQTANFSGGTTYQPYVFGVTANGNAVIIEKIED